MMNMATGEGFPLRQGAGTGSRLVFGGYRGLRRWNSRSRFLFGGFYIYRNFWCRSRVKEVPELSTWQAHTPRGVGAPPPSWAARDSSGPTPMLRGLLLVHKKSSKIGTSIGLRLVFLFCKTQKQGKNRNWHWALG